MAAAEEERTASILAHMNRNHPRELTHYLRHFANVPASQASSNPELRDVTLQGMRIRAGGADYAVPFSPPLSSWDESRPRFVEMDATARRALGLRDVCVSKYVVPRLQDWLVLGSVLFYFVSYASLPWIVPGSRVWAILSDYFPGGPQLFTWLTKKIFVPVVGIHLTEGFFLDRTRLRPHDIDRWSAVWWKWEVSCFFEGFPCFSRFDSVVRQNRAEQESGKKRL